jgi:hypothetical protein
LDTGEVRGGRRCVVGCGVVAAGSGGGHPCHGWFFGCRVEIRTAPSESSRAFSGNRAGQPGWGTPTT